MKTGGKSLIVAGAVLAVVSGLVLAGAGGGPGYGYGPAHGPGAGVVPHSPVPMGPGGPHGPIGPAPGGVFKPLGWSLGLTEEQTKQIGSILEKARPDAVAAEKAIADARGALHEAVVTGAAEGQIQAAAKTLGEAISKQAVLQARMLASAKAVLTAEQRKQLDNIQAKQSHSQQGAPGQGFGGPHGGRWAVPHQSSESNPLASGPTHQPIPGGPAPMEHMSLEQMFKAADTNKDGVLTQQELQAFHDAARSGWQQ